MDHSLIVLRDTPHGYQERLMGTDASMDKETVLAASERAAEEATFLASC